jgi:polyisoprenyl-phosphate glycosyltransferase
MSHGLNANRQANDALISIVIPVHNEAAVLGELVNRIGTATDLLHCRSELIFVNDGSSDESATALDLLAAGRADVRVLHLSRNFGQQASIQAGWSHASGDAVVVMDADLQDDPENIAAFVAKWRDGFDVVYGIRMLRKEGPLKRALFAAFYRLLRLVSRVPIPLDAGSFSLVDRRVADQIASLAECDRFYAGLRSWVGYRQIGIRLERGARYDRQPRVGAHDLWRLAKSAIVSFSHLPLTVFYGIAFLACVAFVSVGAFTLYHKLFTGLAILGWTSTVMIACFFGAINALGIAILGEYILRIYDQVRERPLFVIDRSVNVPHSGADPFSQATGRAGDAPESPLVAAPRVQHESLKRS